MNWIDYDNDGDLDVYITNYGASPTTSGLPNDLYRNDRGTFVRVTEGPLVTDVAVSLASVWGDFDNDGDLDLYVASTGVPNAGAAPDRFYRNDGPGPGQAHTFTRLETGAFVTIPAPSAGAAAADADGDGDLDLYVTSFDTTDGAGWLWRNDQATGHHWLKLRLAGTTANRAAIGAKVHVRATIGGRPVTQLREVSAQNTFNGQSDLVVHVGLGDARQADAVRIEWPGGEVETHTALAADRLYVLTEGEGRPPD